MTDGAKRVFLWIAPRSVSTAFLRAMTNKPNTKVITEPFALAYNLGSDRDIETVMDPENPHVNCTYEDQKRICEQAYEGFETIFVKDAAYAMTDEKRRHLPDGYMHTFLIRDPHKTVSSDYLTWNSYNDKDWLIFRRTKASHVHLYELYRFVTEHLGQETIIVDADDLLCHPERTMKNYCKKVGISYDDKMLQWGEPDKSQIIPCPHWEPWFQKVINSKGFELPQEPRSLDDLPTYVHETINESMVYYDKMYSLRIIPDSK